MARKKPAPPPVDPEAPSGPRLELVAVDSITLDPANVRLHPNRNLEAIKGSLARFGQQRALLVDAAGLVRAGNGTLTAARALGWSEIWIQRTDLVGSEAAAYSLVDNRSGELAEWDDAALGLTLGSLQAGGMDLGVLGFNPDEVAALIQKAAPSDDDLVADAPVDEYLARGTRSIMLVLANDEYDRFIAALDDYCMKNELTNNTEAVIHLVEGQGYAIRQAAEAVA